MKRCHCHSLPVTVLMFAFFSWILIGCGQSTDRPEVQFEKGNLAMEQGRFEDAIRFYDVAAQQMPQRSDVVYERGRAYEQLGLLEKALADYERCLELEPGFEGAINNLGVCLARMNRFEDAVVQFSRLIDNNPANILALRNRGLCQFDLRQFDAALADYDLAVAVDRQDPETWFQRGNVLLEQEAYFEAIDDYSKAIDIDESFAKAWLKRGVARFRCGERTAGMNDLKQAQALNEEIVIPDVDWLKPNSATANSVSRSVAKPLIDLANVADWKQAYSASMQILQAKGIDQIQLAVKSEADWCCILLGNQVDQKQAIYVAVVDDESEQAVIPASGPPAGAKAALLLLKWNGAENAFRESAWIADWNPNESIVSSATVRIQIPSETK